MFGTLASLVAFKRKISMRLAGNSVGKYKSIALFRVQLAERRGFEPRIGY